MTTQQKIREIVKDQFNDFKGAHPLNRSIEFMHRLIRKRVGDEKYLKFLEDGKQKNPRPKYELPNLNNNE